MSTATLRQEFADTMLEVGKEDPNLIVLIGDISRFLLQPFAIACPDRFYNIGICENTILGMAAGLSKLGFYPVVHTIAPFFVERSLEQIKLDFGYQKLGMNMVCVGSAFDYSNLGCTHHCQNDFALLKGIEDMELVYPASPGEFNALFKQTYADGKPTYFRLPKFTHDYGFSKEDIVFGKGVRVAEGSDVSLIAVGPQLNSALGAAGILKEEGLTADVLYLHTIKPFDWKLINASLEKTGRCVVVEEHSMYGGVFDDVLRFSKDIGDVKYASVNVGERFVREYGTYNEYCERLGLTAGNTALKALSLCKDKPKIHVKAKL